MLVCDKYAASIKLKHQEKVPDERIITWEVTMFCDTGSMMSVSPFTHRQISKEYEM